MTNGRRKSRGITQVTRNYAGHEERTATAVTWGHHYSRGVPIHGVEKHYNFSLQTTRHTQASHEPRRQRTTATAGCVLMRSFLALRYIPRVHGYLSRQHDSLWHRKAHFKLADGEDNFQFCSDFGHPRFVIRWNVQPGTEVACLTRLFLVVMCCIILEAVRPVILENICFALDPSFLQYEQHEGART